MRTKLLIGYGLLGVSLLFIGCVVTQERPADSSPPPPPPPTAVAPEPTAPTPTPEPTATAAPTPSATATATASAEADAGAPTLPKKPPLHTKGKGTTATVDGGS